MNDINITQAYSRSILLNGVIRVFPILITCLCLFWDFYNKKFEEIKQIIRDIGVYSSIIVIIMFIYNIGSNTILSYTGFQRIIIGNADPNEFSGLLLSLLFFQFYVILSSKKITKILVGISYIINIVLIFLTASKAGFLGVLLSLILNYFVLDKGKKKTYILLILILISLFIFIFPNLITNVLYRFRDSNSLEELTTNRTLFWKNGIEYILHNNFLFGVGYAVQAEMYIHGINIGYFNVSHNIFISILVKIGIVGLVIFLIILLSILKYVFNNKIIRDNIYRVPILSLLILIFIGQSLSWDYNINIWVLIGINWGILSKIKERININKEVVNV